VKDIRDKALAIEAYARQAKNFEAEARACEIFARSRCEPSDDRSECCGQASS